jgi:CarD family transcriptional regulator
MRSTQAAELTPRSTAETFGLHAVATPKPATSPPRSSPRGSTHEVVVNQELLSKVPSKSATAKKPSQVEIAPADDGVPTSPDAATLASDSAESASPAPTPPAAPPPPPLQEAAPQAAPAPTLEHTAANDSTAAKPTPAPAPQHAFTPNALHRPTAPQPPGLQRPPGGIPGRVVPPPRPMAKAEQFAEGDYVVYPTHGVGKVERIAVEEIAGHKLELIHITFEENRMTLRVPVAKARTAGLRKLASRKLFDDAMAVLKGRARIKRTMWSRRAQEYEAKINSGDPLAIAEVVRDLHRNAGQPDQSFSERQIYEAAMDRLAAELAALDRSDKAAASVKLAEFLKTV